MKRIREFWNLWGMRWPTIEAMTGESTRIGMCEAWRVSKGVLESEEYFESTVKLCHACTACAVINLEGRMVCLNCGAVQSIGTEEGDGT